MQKLELTWIGKGDSPQLEPRILIEQPEYSYGDPDSGNLLIHGDNLLALKALEQRYAGQVKCIYIDPPYNTGSAFQHYDDGLEHSIWLNLMSHRLHLLRKLLSEDGSIWVSIDDNEGHYLKVMMDEIFGRSCFVGSIIWQKADSPRNSARQFSTDHDYILVFSKQPDWKPNRLPRTDEANSIYSNPDDDSRGDWLPGDPYANKPYAKGQYTIKGPTGREFSPPPGRFWRISEEKFWKLDKDGRIWWGPNGSARPSIKRYLSEVSDLVVRTFWPKEDVGSNRTSKNEMRQIFPGTASFATPKPERLIQRILTIATNPGDLVLDSFLGSGTTAAVAHKLGRRWIGVELGEHAYTHCYPRLRQVVDGSDQGGISQAVSWQGGGGFQTYRLAPSLLRKDPQGQWVIDPAYDPDMLAAALARHEGFAYDPHPEVYWKQAHSAKKDFLYTTTQFLTVEALDQLHEQLSPGESLLICAKAFQPGCEGRHARLSLKKIPHVLLGRCEFGRDDYSLHIVNLPEDEDAPDAPLASAGSAIEEEARADSPAEKPEPDSRQGRLF